MKRFLFFAAALTVMFSSCTKEDAYAPSTKNGVEVFSASINVEDGAQTRLELNGRSYLWNVGDGVGVGSFNAPEANVPAYTAEASTNPKFVVTENDYRYFGTWKGGDALYAYYPYQPGEGALDKEDGKVVAKLEISKTQRYEENSFYKNTVPAVGYVEKYNGAETNIKLTVPVALLRLNVKGLGETEGLTLQIKKPTTGYYNLAGNNKVVISTDSTVLSSFGEPASGYDYVEIDFGSKAEPFKYYETTAVFFAVPAGLELYGATLELTNGTETKKIPMDEKFFPEGYFEEGSTPSYKTKANNVTSISSKTFDFGIGEYFVIEKGENNNAARDFILYAFAVQNDYNALAGDYSNNRGVSKLYGNIDDVKTIAVHMGFMTAEETLTPAILAKVQNLKLYILRESIDFNSFDANAMYELYGKAEYEYDDMAKLYRKALKWYMENGNAIEVLGSEGTSITGGMENPVLIDGLTVLGSGITEITSLKNLEFANTTVKAEKDSKYVGFIAANAANANVENVVIGSDNNIDATLASATAYVGGITGFVNVSGNKINVSVKEGATLPAIDHSAAQKVGQIYGYVQVSKNVSFNLATYNVLSLTDHPVVYDVIGDKVIDFTSTLEAPADSEYFGLIAKNLDSNPASIVINGTSYWNGTMAALVDDGYFTAEEFAYSLQDNCNITLTHNIDMMNAPLKFASYAYRSTNIKGQNFIIKNVNGSPVANITGNCALFGTYAILENLTLSGINITTKGLTNEFQVIAGLATTGKATNVTVNDITVTIDKNTPIANTIESIGGVFAVADMNSFNNVEVKSVIVNNNNVAKVSAKTGILAGTISVEPTNDLCSLGKFVISGVSADYAFNNFDTKRQGKLTDSIDEFEATNGYAYKYAFGTINVGNASFPENGQTKAELKLAEGTVVGPANVIAAGIVFNSALTTNAKAVVEYDSNEYKHCEYYFVSDSVIGKEKLSFFGFDKN